MVTLVRAPNPSPMTLTGTNSYVIDCGDGEALAIDPGPAIETHLTALVAAARRTDAEIVAIALTHGHPDHSAGAASLAVLTGAPVYAHPASKVRHDAELPLEGDLHIGNTALQTIDAPGHSFDHVVFYLEGERALFTGDVVLGEGTTVIAPPGGAMRPYQHTLQRLADEFRSAEIIYGGHGPPVAQPQVKLAEYIAHRQMREDQILAALAHGPRTIPELVIHIYGPQRQPLWPAMARQVLAHLIALEREGRVSARRLERPLTADESAMLNPNIEAIVGPAEAALIVAELGTELRLEAIYEYRLREGASATV